MSIQTCEDLEIELQIPGQGLFELVGQKPKNFIPEKFSVSYLNSYLLKFLKLVNKS